MSVTGTTGERAAVAESLAATLAHAKAHSPVPVAVGFGISTPEQAAAAAAAGADGVIVGSRLVRAATEADAKPGRILQLRWANWSRRSQRRSSARLPASWACFSPSSRASSSG